MAKASEAGQKMQSTSPLPDNQEQQVREIAFRLFEERGREPGHEWEDWLRAEAEVRETRHYSQAA